MEQFDILGFYSEFVLQLKEQGSVFTMSLAGALRPLLEENVSDYWFEHDRIYFLINRPLQRSSTIKIYRAKEREIVLEGEMEAGPAGRIVFANSEQIILG
jgi:hypothetical protein